MASKIQERIYLNWFLESVGWTDCAIEDKDPPDFLLHVQDRVIGVEVTNIYVDEKKKGSKRREQESYKQKQLRRLAQRYYEKTAVPILVKANMRACTSPIDLDQTVFSLLECAELRVWEEAKVELETCSRGALLLYVRRLPKEFTRYARWICIDNQVGWVQELSNEIIMKAVKKKQDKLVKYRSVCEHTTLLLVADRTLNSGRLEWTGEPLSAVRDCGFDSVWVLIYPLKVHKVD
jgi:hypothetical protein